MFTRTFAALICTTVLAIGTAASALATGPGCTPAGHTYVPPAGRTVLTVGQYKDSIDGYVAGTGDSPGGTMVYTTVAAPLLGLVVPYANVGDGTQDMQHYLATYPNATVNVGLYLVDQLDNINQGLLDTNIDLLADILKDADRPVYLRIGYEFDGPWNHYEPGPFVAAWKRIVDRFRARAVSNVSFVWHSATSLYGRHGGHPISAWYPGECYVDVAGVSIFDQPYQGTAGWALVDELADFGHLHGHPVMISESTPIGRYTPTADAGALWDEWYAPVLDFITRQDVRIFSYINANWEGYGNWPGWGDSRVEQNPALEARWLAAVGDVRFWHGTSHLYGDLGYTPVGGTSVLGMIRGAQPRTGGAR
jgi:hypothetical protein